MSARNIASGVSLCRGATDSASGVCVGLVSCVAIPNARRQAGGVRFWFRVFRMGVSAFPKNADSLFWIPSGICDVHVTVFCSATSHVLVTQASRVFIACSVRSLCTMRTPDSVRLDGLSEPVPAVRVRRSPLKPIRDLTRNVWRCPFVPTSKRLCVRLETTSARRPFVRVSDPAL